MLSRTLHLIGQLAAAAMCLFPPFRVGYQENRTVAMGYPLLFTAEHSLRNWREGARNATLVPDNGSEHWQDAILGVPRRLPAWLN